MSIVVINRMWILSQSPATKMQCFCATLTISVKERALSFLWPVAVAVVSVGINSAVNYTNLMSLFVSVFLSRYKIINTHVSQEDVVYTFLLNEPA